MHCKSVLFICLFKSRFPSEVQQEWNSSCVVVFQEANQKHPDEEFMSFSSFNASLGCVSDLPIDVLGEIPQVCRGWSNGIMDTEVLCEETTGSCMQCPTFF